PRARARGSCDNRICIIISHLRTLIRRTYVLFVANFFQLSKTRSNICLKFEHLCSIVDVSSSHASDTKTGFFERTTHGGQKLIRCHYPCFSAVLSFCRLVGTPATHP